jgi:pimeloyl-ACP methyl ester carboxylesterase
MDGKNVFGIEGEVRSKTITKYEKDQNPERVEQINEGVEHPKLVSFDLEGEKVQIEYIEVPAKKQEQCEGEKEKVIILFPGFCASYIPYVGAVKELAGYMGNYRIICLSPLDSGKSSSLKESHLQKMGEVYRAAFQKLGIDSAHTEATVIGHSRSDIIALELARSVPELVKNIALVNGITGKKEGLAGLTYDVTEHTFLDITPERMKGLFKGEVEAARNYLNQTRDFLRNMLKPTHILNQFGSLNERKKVNVKELLSQLKSNVLILSGTGDITDYKETRENIYENLPENIQAEHHLEIGGLHDEINAHPEGFVLKFRKWMESVEKV